MIVQTRSLREIDDFRKNDATSGLTRATSGLHFLQNRQFLGVKGSVWRARHVINIR